MAVMLSSIQMMTIGSERLYGITFAGISLQVCREGVETGILTFLRISGSMGTVLLLIGSLRFGDFMRALRWFKLPVAFAEVMVMAVKYIFIFKNDAFTIRKAQRARLGYKGPVKSIHSIGNVAGIVLFRAFDRSKTLAGSMKSRGYDGRNIIFDEGSNKNGFR
jgi:cobalt/nickel transport system permease protein